MSGGRLESGAATGPHRGLLYSMALAVLAHAAALAGLAYTSGAETTALLHATRAAGPAAKAHNPSARAAHAQRGDAARTQRARRGAARAATAHKTTASGSKAVTRFVVVAKTPASSRRSSPRAASPPGAAHNARVERRRSAAADARAAYLNAWRARIETLGDRRYPARLFGARSQRRLTLAVRVDSAGRLRALRILHPSGSRALDKAALRIVRSAAPFAPFSPSLAGRSQVINFAYDWLFRPFRQPHSRPAD